MRRATKWSGRRLTISAFGIAVLVASLIAVVGSAQMKMPKMETLRGTIIDFTCAAKGKAVMDSWHNAENNDHMTEQGNVDACATMCLKGGQPAALFSGGRIRAAFACNPQATLANYANQAVEVQGFWGGDGRDVKAFIPQKIKARGQNTWTDVNCATMHN